jgi:CubicO group peptidase (beta-lactamase class C family)
MAASLEPGTGDLAKSAAEQPEPLASRLDAAIREMKVAGASIAGWHAGRLVTASAGWVNAECRIQADDNSIFQIGSITKVFTATLVLMLQEQGLIGLDDPVTRHLPDFRIAGAPAPDALTVRTLLDYTSGIAGDFFADFGPGPEALARYVEACADLPLLFPPGTMRGYNSTAYCVAGRIVEAVTGESFDAAIARLLLRPLGMERFAFFSHDVARYRTAIGHVLLGNGFAAAETLRLPHCMSASGASLTTTATDLLRFGLLHLRQGRNESGAQLLSADACRAMTEPARHLPPGDSPVRIGWASVPLGEGELICASGETAHQNAFVGFSRAHDLVIAILANTSGGATRLLASIGRDLIAEATGARLVMPMPLPASPVPDVPLKPYMGDYTNHTRIAVTQQDGALALAMRAQDPTTNGLAEQALLLTPIGAHRFVAGPPEQPAAVFEFLFMDGPKVPASHIASGGRVFARCDADGRTRY